MARPKSKNVGVIGLGIIGSRVAGASGGPIRSRLGFHLVALTTVLPAQEMTSAEATPDR